MCSKQHYQQWLAGKCRQCTCLLKVSMFYEWLPLIFNGPHWATLLNQEHNDQNALQGGRGQRHHFLPKQAGSASR